MLLLQTIMVILVVIALWVARRDIASVFWPKFVEERQFQHLTYAVMLCLFLLWSAQAGIKPGLNIHFLALTTLTLMYGWKVAFLLTIPVSLILALVGNLNWSALADYLALSCLLPIIISHIVFTASYRWLPRNIFVFIFVAGFINGALTGSLHLLAISFYHLGIQNHTWNDIQNNYLIFLPLLAFPEALLNGMAVTLLSVFQPQWLRAFSDKDYIYNHYHND